MNSAPLVDFGRQFYDRGWMEGTGGNLSVRLTSDPLKIRITPTGVNKGYLQVEDLLDITDKQPAPSHAKGHRPSAETAIHLAIYRAVPHAGAVFHVHPVYATVLSATYGHPTETRAFPVEWIEILKGIQFPEGSKAEFPVIANWQTVEKVGDDLAAYLQKTAKPVPGFLIYNHGLTVWGKDVEEARNHLEVMEFVCKVMFRKMQLAGKA